MSNSLQPHGLQHARPPCPSPTPGVHSNSCPLSRWCYPTISSSVTPFSSRLQSFPASGSFPTSHFFTSGGQSIGVSASTSVCPVNTQDWSPLGWTGWISLQSKGLSRVISNTTIQNNHIRYLFFSFWFVVVQLLSCVWLFVTPWTASHQASLTFTIGFTSVCIIGSGFIHLIRTDWNVFLLWLSNIPLCIPWIRNVSLIHFSFSSSSVLFSASLLVAVYNDTFPQVIVYRWEMWLKDRQRESITFTTSTLKRSPATWGQLSLKLIMAQEFSSSIESGLCCRWFLHWDFRIWGIPRRR